MKGKRHSPVDPVLPEARSTAACVCTAGRAFCNCLTTSSTRLGRKTPVAVGVPADRSRRAGNTEVGRYETGVFRQSPGLSCLRCHQPDESDGGNC